MLGAGARGLAAALAAGVGRRPRALPALPGSPRGATSGLAAARPGPAAPGDEEPRDRPLCTRQVPVPTPRGWGGGVGSRPGRSPAGGAAAAGQSRAAAFWVGGGWTGRSQRSFLAFTVLFCDPIGSLGSFPSAPCAWAVDKREEVSVPVLHASCRPPPRSTRWRRLWQQHTPSLWPTLSTWR